MSEINIFIGNLADQVGIDDLEDFFTDFKGQFMSINLKKGFGFIKFYERKDADRCMEKMNHRMIYGRKINLELGDRSGGGNSKGHSGNKFSRNDDRRGRSRSRSRDRRDSRGGDNRNNRSRSRDRNDRNNSYNNRDNRGSYNNRGRSPSPVRDPRDSHRGQTTGYNNNRNNSYNRNDRYEDRNDSREIKGHAYASSNLPRHMGKIRDSYNDRDRYNNDRYSDNRGPPRRRTYRTKFALVLKNLHSDVNWKDLEKEAQKGADVQMTFGDANKIVPNEGIITFETASDLKRAKPIFDGNKQLAMSGELVKASYEYPEVLDPDYRGPTSNNRPHYKNAVDKVSIDVGESDKRRDSRSKSRDRKMSRSRSRSRTRSRSRSNSPANKRRRSNSRSRSRSNDRNVKVENDRRSRSGSRSQLYSDDSD